MRPFFTDTLYDIECPEKFKALPPFISQQILSLWKEMKNSWGNTPNIKKWIKKAITAANRGNNSAAKLQNLQKYLHESGYYQRKNLIETAVNEFGWQPGYIYILKNIYMPDLVKVGRVWGKGRTAYDRIKDSDMNCTGVPCSFDVLFEIFTLNSKDSESKAHNLIPYRIGSSEFFKNGKIENVKSIIIDVVKKVDHDAYLKSIGPRQIKMFS